LQRLKAAADRTLGVEALALELAGSLALALAVALFSLHAAAATGGGIKGSQTCTLGIEACCVGG
jgi:hypothetical protein